MEMSRAGVWVRARWASSNRRRLIRVMIESLPGISLWVAVWALLNAALPNLLIIFLGKIVGALPAASRDGMASPPGHHLTVLLYLFAVLLCATFLLTPLQTGLAAIAKVRLTYALQTRLMQAVSRPTGIAHLEDPAVLDRLELAQGSLMSYSPGDAPMALASVVGNRLQGLVACIVIGVVFRWWVGIAIALLWLLVRIPQRRSMTNVIRLFAGDAGIMRRAMYFSGLAAQPYAAKEIRLFGLGDWVTEQLRHHWIEGMNSSWRVQSRIFKQMPLLGIPVLIVFLGTCALLARDSWAGTVSLSAVAIVLALMPRTYIVGAYTTVDHNLEWSLSVLPELERIETELKSDDFERWEADVVDPMEIENQDVHFIDVRFTYPNGNSPVFEGLDLTIAHGKATAIVGINGSGKTTLVKLLTRLHEPSGGRINVGETSLQDFNARSWQRQIAVVFQDFNRYPESAFENIEFGAPEKLGQHTIAEDLIRRVGMFERLICLPDGLDTVLAKEYEGGSDLSGGEWQRIALARGLFAVENGAKYLILDEPTSQLDVRGEAEFYERFIELTAGLTTVIISHRFATVRLADDIYVIGDGKVLEHGSHSELMSFGGRYAEMYAMQASRFADTNMQVGES